MSAQAQPFVELRISLLNIGRNLKVLQLNDEEFLATDSRDCYKYDVKSNRWTRISLHLAPLPLNFICYDRSTNSLFFQDSSHSKLKRIDISNGQIVVYGRTGFNVESMIVLDGEMHLFGIRPNTHSIHRICSKLTGETLRETLNCDYWINSFRQCYFSAQRNSLIKIRWNEHPLSSHSTFALLQEYSLNSQQWVTLQWSRTPVGPIADTEIVGTADARYMFVFGGQRSYTLDKSDQITIYDFKKQNVWASNVKCPEKGGYRAVLLEDRKGNDLAVFGFINSAFKEQSFRNVQIFPIYLIQLVANWYSNERIYLLKAKDLVEIPNSSVGRLWQITVDDLLKL